jgi:hypothetical protein
MGIYRRQNNEGRRRKVASLLVLLGAAIILRLRDHKIPSAKINDEFLPKPPNAPWELIWKDGDDAAFMASTSLTRASFMKLLAVFSKHYKHNFTTHKGGRPARLLELSFQ